MDRWFTRCSARIQHETGGYVEGEKGILEETEESDVQPLEGPDGPSGLEQEEPDDTIGSYY